MMHKVIDMKNKSISVKLFIITVIFCLIFISGTMYLQSHFFEKFYHDKKIRSLQTNIEQFKKLYIDNMYNSSEVINDIYKFEDNNNSRVVIISANGTVKYLSQYMDQSENPNIKTNALLTAIQNWSYDEGIYNQVVEQKKDYMFEFKISSSSISSIAIISPIVVKDKTKDVMFVVFSLQPIGEAASVIKDYYMWIYLSVIFLILILSLAYSVVISRPLVKINKVASRMLELDFSTKCDVKSQDEIGNLSNTLNFLSEKLGSTLTELTDANIKLKEDIEKERQLEIMRKEFVAGVSHELKTPISLIEGYAEGIKDNIVEGEDRDYYVDVIIDESKKMGSLVSDMLDLSQMETGNFKLNVERFYVKELVGYTLKKYTNKLQVKNISLTTNMLEEDIEVYGDKIRIEQVITNFMTNAIRHTINDGKITVNVFDNGSNILIEVENEGNIISEQDMERIWERFYRIEKSRQRELGGTGLGLAIVKNILLLHESNYGVKNTEKGVKFYFTLKKALLT